MQVLPHGLDLAGLQTGLFGGVTWQFRFLAMQALPHGWLFGEQWGAALATAANANAATAPIMRLRMARSSPESCSLRPQVRVVAC